MRPCEACSFVCLERAQNCANCGAPLDHRPAQLMVEGRYRIEKQIGRGGMGVVYRAHDVALERHVALKLLAKEQLGSLGGMQRFLSEARALAKVRNAHVAEIYALGEHDDTLYFSMELVRGDNLQRLVEAHAAQGVRVPLHRALTLVRQIAEGLSAVHAVGLVHRDVKPENVVIEASTGRPVLVDFGLASTQRALQIRSREKVVAGTPAYMAPEQALLRPSGEFVTARTDVYALACMAFELLTGRLPFEERSVEAMIAKHASAPSPAPSSFDAALAPFDAVFARALAKSPDGRHESVRAFAAELEAAGAKLIAFEPPPGSEPRPEADTGVASVLIVDDDPVFQKIAETCVRRGLEGTSVDVHAAGSGELAGHRRQRVARRERRLPLPPARGRGDAQQAGADPRAHGAGAPDRGATGPLARRVPPHRRRRGQGRSQGPPHLTGGRGPPESSRPCRTA
ncbi:MAG: serine/threonine protein kinase [Deltaproteobacteria bacterium]|nr:serine/threonine protein kinase [Deltaproteobacteria bacterium]